MPHVERAGNFLIRHAPCELKNRGSRREVADPQRIEEVRAEPYSKIACRRAPRLRGAMALQEPPKTGKPNRNQRENQQQSARFGAQKLTLPSGSIDTSMPSGMAPCCPAGSRKIPGAGHSISRATSAPRARIASASDNTIALGALSL